MSRDTPNSRPDPAQSIPTATERSLKASLEQHFGSAASSEPIAPPAIPDHTLLKRIGGGSYGDVWLARSALGQWRAVKIVYRSRFQEQRPYEREFHGILKYEPVSRTHDRLVPVLHVGRNDPADCFYYVMELADPLPRPKGSAAVGEATEGLDYAPHTLRSEFRLQDPMTAVKAAQLVAQLAGALQHLHSHGLVHRDIKPSNVIFVKGQPKLADIGLVTDAGESKSFVGTEGFIPPEGPGTEQSDIYSLGKLLYEIATGRDRLDFPQLPAGLDQSPEREPLLELNEVITRACAPQPKDRYASAAEFEAELKLFLGGRSLRHTRSLERHLVRLKTVAVAACLGLAVSATALWISEREEVRERARADAETSLRHRAELAEKHSQSQLHQALLEQARATVVGGELGHRARALEALRRAAAISNTVELRQAALTALALPELRFQQEWNLGNEATFAQFDPEFRRLAISRGSAATEIRSGNQLQTIASLPAATSGICYRTLWSPNGRYLLVKRDQDSAGDRSDLEIWEAGSSQRLLLLLKVPRDAFAFHPTLPRLAVSAGNEQMALWDLKATSIVSRIRLPATPDRIKFSADATKLVASYPSGHLWTISVHDLDQGAQLSSCQFGTRLTNFDVDPAGRWIAVTDTAGLVHLMEMATGSASAIGKHPNTAATVTFHPNSPHLISGGWERELICWNVRTRQRVFTLPLNSFHFQFSGDGLKCATFADGRLQQHLFEKPAGLREFEGDLGSLVNQAAFSADGRWFAASGDKRLGLWGLTNEMPVALVQEAADARPQFTPDSRELFGSSRVDACVRISLVPEVQRVPLQKPHGFSSLCLASNTLIWTTDHGSQVGSSADHFTEAWVPTVRGVSRASSNGKWLGIFTPFSSQLQVHRLPSFDRGATMTAQGAILDFAFSPLGEEIAISSRRCVELWNLESPHRQRALTNCHGIVYAHSPGQAWIRRDRLAGLYDLNTFQPRLLLPNGMQPVALSPDGHSLALTLEARRVLIWDLEELRQQLQGLGIDWR